MKERIKKALRKLSLVQKFSAAVIALIFIIMVIVNALIITHQRRALESEMNGNHLAVVWNLAKDAVEPLILKDPLRLDKMVRITAQTPGCAYAGIIDRNERIVAHTDRKMLGGTLSGKTQGHAGVVMREGREYLRDNYEEDIKEIMVPVKAGDEVVGMVMMGFSKGSTEGVIEDNLKGLKRYVFLISGIVMLIGVWGAFGLAKLLTTPMKKLKEKMELVQAGNLDVEVPNDYLQNCRDVLDCDAMECPAYGKKRCWNISGTMCYGGLQGDVFEKICDCKNCVVYRESCGDEIGELVEVFNQMVKRLKESIEKLEETSKENIRLEKLSALGEMSMTVAHEIKNPLNAIRGAASYLQNNFKGEVLKEFLSIIEEETVRLNEIVTSFLRFSRPSPLNLQVSDMNRVVSETVELIRQEATENNVEVITSLDERIPPFKFDVQQFKQALLNIMVNSIDATKSGDTIKITTEVFDSMVAIMVKDTGEGMSEDVISEMFKPFFTTKTRGSGLGLACVERIVKGHRGDISVKSETGKGTEFIIIMPVWN
ncbi:MAG: ATP-binding protein [Nitrospirae bacterium]|nr:ATP-binding protein [Nitrospirota bacterium]MCL5978435.1 ATP-binding protein [Nitrospirota bacterium]